MKRRRGFTLMEVVVALVLMGSVLAGSLLAFSRHRKQLSMADKRIEATMIADQLVTELSSQRGGIPIEARGRIAGKPSWIWLTSPVGATQLATVPMQVVRFQILELSPTPTPLVSVDIVESSRLP
jgi:prepilin-type N-terminal cleavage/methylation domain-containing protein